MVCNLQEKVCIAFRQYRLYQRNLSTFFLKSNSSERFGMSGPERPAFYVLSSALGRNREKVLPSPGRLLTFRYPP